MTGTEPKSPNRSLVLDFLNLPLSDRREILLELELVSPQEYQEQHDEVSMLMVAFERARSRNQIDAFKKMCATRTEGQGRRECR